MAALKSSPDSRDAKQDSPLAIVMREFEELVVGLETGLLRSLEDAHKAEGDAQLPRRREDVRHEACRLAAAELSTKYTRKQIRRALTATESQGRRVEEQLHHQQNAHDYESDDGEDEELCGIHNGYFELYSSELFDLLGQPTDLRFGTLRFHHHAPPDPTLHPEAAWMSVELALGSSFFVADSLETLPFHAFKMPRAPSLQNRGILSRKPEEHGAFPDYDSWLLFTFLGEGCLKLEVPVEMCADVYGGPLRGRENEEVQFWGIFIEDDAS